MYDIKRLIDEQNSKGGVDLSELEIGTKIEAQTHNTLYSIEVLDKSQFNILDDGKRFPVPTQVWISGSTWGGSMIKNHWLGIDMHIEIVSADHGTLLTTPVEWLKIKSPKGNWAYKIEK